MSKIASPEDVGVALRAARGEVPAKDLCRMLGLSTGAWYRYENGHFRLDRTPLYVVEAAELVLGAPAECLRRAIVDRVEKDLRGLS